MAYSLGWFLKNDEGGNPYGLSYKSSRLDQTLSKLEKTLYGHRVPDSMLPSVDFRGVASMWPLACQSIVIAMKHSL